MSDSNQNIVQDFLNYYDNNDLINARKIIESLNQSLDIPQNNVILAQIISYTNNKQHALPLLIQATNLDARYFDIICNLIYNDFIHDKEIIINFCHYYYNNFEKNHKAFHIIGMIETFYGNSLSAIEYLNKSKNIKNSLSVNLKLINQYQHSGQYCNAIKIYKNNKKLFKDKRIFDYYMADIYLLNGKYIKGFNKNEIRFEYLLPISENIIYKNYISTIIPNLRKFDYSKILIIEELGFGDIFCMLRFCKSLKQKKFHITILYKKDLARFYQNICEIDKLIKFSDFDLNDIKQFDFQVPIGSLPFAHQVKLDNIPPPKLNLKEPFCKMQSEIIKQPALKIGFFWHGNNGNRLRWIGLSEMFAIFPPTLHLYCFQIEFTKDEEELMNKRGNITILKPQITDWADTAGFLEQMDLLITIDSGIANLASALGMGNKLWVMLPLDADWRWYCTKTNYPPWHPDARTFRQNKFNDWSNVIDDVRTELNKFLEDWAP